MFDSDPLSAKASVYTDFQGLSELKRQAQRQTPEALRAVAKQFEGLFMDMMLKSMRQAGDMGGGLMDSQQSRFYQDMYDKQLTTQLSSQSGGIGLAEVLVRQLQGTLPPEPGVEARDLRIPQRGPLAATAPRPPGPPEPPEPPEPPRAAETGGTVHRGAPAEPATGAVSAPAPVASPVSSAVADAQEPVRIAPAMLNRGNPVDPTYFESPQDFIRHMLPHARQAAERLGVEPRALIAQAALETGWGKAVIRRGDGASSHNLFNIKADQRWDGESVAKRTLEFRQGVAVQEQARFRSYDSYADSFSDYVDFLERNPRYRDALERAEDPEAFIEGLHKAGYATDPAYARKIRRIMNGDFMNATLASLQPSKNPNDRSLT